MEITNWSVAQGESFKLLTELRYDISTGSLPLDITDYSFVGTLRENYTTDDVAATFTITKIAPYTSGSIFIALGPTDTLSLVQRKYVYDINMSSGSIAPTVRRMLGGQFTVHPSATK
jgi:hypothetical protein